MVKPRVVLLIGGHGRTGQHITRILLSHGHTVYSLIRNTDQLEEIQSLGSSYPEGRLRPLIHDLNGISSHEVMELLGQGSANGDGLGEGGIEWVIWAAGAKSNIPRHPQDQLSVERDAAIRFIDEARGKGVGPGGGVRRFILISACICRREVAGWWTNEESQYWNCLRKQVMPTYVEAKTEVDELLVSECRMHVKNVADAAEKERAGMEDVDESFSVVSVRPGTLGEHPGTGKVQLGRTRLTKDALSREDLARVVVALCETKGIPQIGGGIGCRWLDVGVGEDEIESAVAKCIQEDVDTSRSGIESFEGAGKVEEKRGGGFSS
ncbi:hypothetical protein DFH27DRAFT_175665 [Peziza echinospora]|nr:hypothetical protein DFH27DRAFT_175665 [Peziza echinospora]